MASHLEGATSAYLRSAIHQPVRWHTWSPAAFARARDEERPVLLDIGAVWCHWCHVMDRESYESDELAELLNSEWICIKVDRDERPDVDARYQRAVQALSGQGGWPLTVFLTPDGEVFFGGTYFPPEGTHGRPGFRTILTELGRLWREERPRLVEQAGILRRRIAEVEGETLTAGAVTPQLITDATDGFSRVFDFRHGGFGNQPKFPHPGALRLLLNRWRDTGQDWAREMVDRTLTAMAQGGIHDQVGGGFHRYSVDARWSIPHFEKMLYDNAELLSVYCDALASGKNPLYRRTIDNILHWSQGIMMDPAGGWAASQDADINLDDDGDYFTWTSQEIHDACGGELGEAMVSHFGVGGHGKMPHNADRNVLHAAADVSADVRVAGIDALRRARAERPAPFIDRTVQVGWSALMASACLKAGATCTRDEVTAHAIRTIARLYTEGAAPGGGLLHTLGGAVQGLLEDQVFGAQAALDAFEHTGDPRWLTRSQDLMQHILDHYAAENGLLRDRTGSGEGVLNDPVFPIHDAPTPSGNGVAAETLLRLAAHDPTGPWHAAAHHLLEGLGGTLGDLGVHGASLLLAADRMVNPETRVVVVAGDDDGGRAVGRAARAGWAARRVLTLRRPGDDPDGLPDYVQAMLTSEHPRAYVCIGTACKPPAATPEALSEALSA